MIYNEERALPGAVQGAPSGAAHPSLRRKQLVVGGRGYYVSDQPRIYVNNKTRNARPFFVHPNIHAPAPAVFPRMT